MGQNFVGCVLKNQSLENSANQIEPIGKSTANQFFLFKSRQSFKNTFKDI